MKISDQNVQFDSDLLQKYDLPLPRYTSYPPATQLASDFSEHNFRSAIAASPIRSD